MFKFAITIFFKLVILRFFNNLLILLVLFYLFQTSDNALSLKRLDGTSCYLLCFFILVIITIHDTF